MYLTLSVGLIVYLLVSGGIARGLASSVPCRGLDIVVNDQGTAMFVTPEDIDVELGNLSSRIDTMRAAGIDLYGIERYLNALPNVERANCVRLNNDRIRIDVDPMVPVARIFDGRESYYINHDGKRLTASLRYQVDVPVIVGRFDSINTPARVLPFIESVEKNESWRSMVASYEVNALGDIIVVPTITGHVINFGDGSNIQNKFDRLRTFYARVMPVKGWNYYDTLSVKFAGQVVAQIAPGHNRQKVFEYDDSDFEEEAGPAADDEGSEPTDRSMLVPTV